MADRQPERLYSPVIFEVLVLFRRSLTRSNTKVRPLASRLFRKKDPGEPKTSKPKPNAYTPHETSAPFRKKSFFLMQKLENLMPNLEAKFWTIATAVWTTVTAFWKLEDTHPKKSVLEVLKLGPKKKNFSKWSKKKTSRTNFC